jgi:membrane protein required for colicin V production
VTILDWALIGLFGYFFIRGLFRGFLLELFGLLALLAGYFAARLLSPVFGLWLSNNTPLNRWLSALIAAILLFVTAAALVSIAAHLLRTAVHSINLAGFDRVLGAGFGLIKALLTILAIFLLLSLTPWSKPIGEYATRGQFSSWFWLGSQVIREATDFEPLATTQAMARWLRAAGVNEEAVHIATDQPDLLEALLDQARQGQIDLPVEQILQGEPALKLPKSYDLDPETQDVLVRILEDSNTTATEKARLFWRELSVSLETEKQP